MDRLGAGRVIGATLVKLDAARGEKRAHAVVARLAVDVLVVVAYWIERDDCLVCPRGALAQVAVERLLPGLGMYLGCLGQHSVEVEQARGDGGG